MSKFNTFKEGVKLVALLQASLEQMDELKGTVLYKQKLKQQLGNTEKMLERALTNPLAALDKEDPDLLTRIQSNIELVLGMDLEELAMLRAEVDEYRENKKKPLTPKRNENTTTNSSKGVLTACSKPVYQTGTLTKRNPDNSYLDTTKVYGCGD